MKWTRTLILVSLLCGGVCAREPAPDRDFTMPAWKAAVLGVVEGLTEYLPVSSTGHLILTERALRISGDEASRRAADTYTIVIQIGAILAVAWVYHPYLARMGLGLLGRDPGGLRLLRNLLLAFIPAAVVGLLFVDWIKSFLFGLWPVAAAWFVGGVALMIWGHRSKDSGGSALQALEDLPPGKALLIGLLQVIAVWPGTSRSLVTILGGRLAGLNLRESVIFSFLLGMVTLSASTAYDLWRNGSEMIEMFGMQSLVIGLTAAYISAWAAVRWMVEYLKTHGLEFFGGYRVGLAVLTALLLLTGVLSP